MMAGNFTACKKTDQWHIAQGAPHDLQLGAWRAKVRATATRATDINGSGNAPGWVRG